MNTVSHFALESDEAMFDSPCPGTHYVPKPKHVE